MISLSHRKHSQSQNQLPAIRNKTELKLPPLSLRKVTQSHAYSESFDQLKSALFSVRAESQAAVKQSPRDLMSKKDQILKKYDNVYSCVRDYHENVSNMFTASKYGAKCAQKHFRKHL